MSLWTRRRLGRCFLCKQEIPKAQHLSTQQRNTHNSHRGHLHDTGDLELDCTTLSPGNEKQISHLLCQGNQSLHTISKRCRQWKGPLPTPASHDGSSDPAQGKRRVETGMEGAKATKYRIRKGCRAEFGKRSAG